MSRWLADTRIVDSLLCWFGENARDLPWRRTRDPYAIWVSEVMLQQTQVKTVLPYWKRWMRALPTIRSLARAKPAKIHKLWEGLGYYSRVQNLQRAAQTVLAKHDGKLPQVLDELLALPGIGRYTAGAICSIAFNQPAPILDGNVTRVLTRLFAISGNPRTKAVNAKLWDLAEDLVRRAASFEASHTGRSQKSEIRNPKPDPLRRRDSAARTNSKRTSPESDKQGRQISSKAANKLSSCRVGPRALGACASFNQALMELGAVVCTARDPQCGGCPVQRWCAARQQNRVAAFPAISPRPATIRQRFAAFVLKRRGRYFVRQRPAGQINGQLWEFPKAQVNGVNLENAAQSALGAAPIAMDQLCTIKHSITRYRITLEVFRAFGERLGNRRLGRWFNLRGLRRLAFTSADKKILQRLRTSRLAVCAGLALATASVEATAAGTANERQLTHTAKNHILDNNDNFSPDGRYLCYDTREMVGPGLENSRSVEMVQIATGHETVLYEAKKFVSGAQAAPGVAAVSFAPTEKKVVFIHGPPLDEVPVRGYYGKPNRQGAEVAADGKGVLRWLDKRDVEASRDTIPGAHRGGTHRHEYSLDGKRIGFTYDDFLLPAYERTAGYMERHPRAPAPALCYFALLVPVVPRGAARPGEIERAFGDSWVGQHGLMRAFIGKVRERDGTYQESLFVVDVPADVDITTADSGSATRFPSPPKGIRIRRLTHTRAAGIVRGSWQGDRIAYYAEANGGKNQIFVIPSNGSDEDPNAANRPVQVTHFASGAGPGLRWHPSGNWIVCTSNAGVAVVCVKPGPSFGETMFLTAQGDGLGREHLVLSLDGKLLAYDRAVPTQDKAGKTVKTYNGLDPSQIFILPFPNGK